MTFEVILYSNQRGYFHPGDCVNGVVTLSAPRSGRAESVSISLVGRTAVYIRQSAGETARSCGYLCRQHQTLEKELHFRANERFSWPFAFHLAQHASFLYQDEIDPTNVDGAFRCESPWRGSSDAEGLALPPSVRYKGTKFDCHVEYVLQARLIRPPAAHIFSNTDVSAYTEIKVVPSPTTMGPVIEAPFLPFHSYHQTFSLRPSRKTCLARSLKQKLPWADGRDSQIPLPLTATRFSLHVMVPRFLNPRGRSSVQIALRATRPCNDGHEKEFDLEIQKFQLDLVSHTKVRAGSMREAESQKIRLTEGTCQTPVHEESPGELQYCKGRSELDNDDYFRFVREKALGYTHLEEHNPITTPRQTYIIPEFTTYNIFRAYSLKVKCQLKYGEERFTFNKDGIPVELINWGPPEVSARIRREDHGRVRGSSGIADSANTLHGHDAMGFAETTVLEPPPAYRA